MILSSSTPKHSCLKSLPKHEWKRSSHTQSVSVFRRGVTALSSPILFLCFLGFCFPSGHDTFPVNIGHLFPIFGAELKRYLSCNSCVPTQTCTFPIFGAELKRYLSCNSCVPTQRCSWFCSGELVAGNCLQEGSVTGCESVCVCVCVVVVVV